MAKVIKFSGLTKGPVPVQSVLAAAKDCQDVLVLGIDDKGEFYAAASMGNSDVALRLAATFQHKLLNGELG